MKCKAVIPVLSIAVFLALCLSIFLHFSKSKNNIDEDFSDAEMIIALSHLSAYRFVFYKDMTLTVSFGPKSEYRITSMHFMESIKEEATVTLDTDTFNEVILLAQKLVDDNVGELRYGFGDIWTVAVITHERVYEATVIPDNEGGRLNELISFLKEISPLPIDQSKTKHG